MAKKWEAKSLSDLLKQTKVSQIPHKEILTILSTETPARGFELLFKHNIQSAPVFDESTKKYIGFLDVRDLVSYTVFAFENRDKVAYTTHQDRIHTLVNNVTISYLARRNPVHGLQEETATLMDAAVLLAKGCHRVPIFDKDDKIVNIISQSNLIRLFSLHLATTLKEETSIKLKELEIGSSPVLSVSKETKAIDAFRKLDGAGRSGLAILGDDGKLLGHISGKDLKLFVWSTHSYDFLELSVIQFLSKIRMESTAEDRSPSISCTIEDSLSAVIGKLAATTIHRIFIVKSSTDYTLLKIISLTDVLRAILLLEMHNLK